jgi:hypothetical protein
MTAKTPPTRHWRSYGNETLPTGAEARDEPFAAFPSWFLRIECDRCGKDRMVNESHAPWRDRALRDILKRMRHDGCGGLPGRAELLTGIEGASSRGAAKKYQHSGHCRLTIPCSGSHGSALVARALASSSFMPPPLTVLWHRSVSRDWYWCRSLSHP